MAVQSKHSRGALMGFEGKVFLEDLREQERVGFVVCAFFTPGDGFEAYARRLARSCQGFGLPYSLWLAPAVHRSISLRGSTDLRFTKASFITFNLDRLPGVAVAYLDVDAYFVAEPTSLVRARASQCDLAIYNWLNDPHNEAYLPANGRLASGHQASDTYVFSHRVLWSSSEQLICSGMTQYYGNTAPARLLLEAWQQTIAGNSRSADDECLNYAHNNAVLDGLRLHSLWLDKAYARCPWWPHVEPVVLHPDIPARGQLSRAVEPAGNRRCIYLERCVANDTPALFPPDGGVDTRTGTVFRHGPDKQPIPVGHYAGPFWIYDENAGLDEGVSTRG